MSVIQDHLEFIIRWRDDGVRTFVNESYCSYANASSDELLGTSFMTSIVEEDREELREKLACCHGRTARRCSRASDDCPRWPNRLGALDPSRTVQFGRRTHRISIGRLRCYRPAPPRGIRGGDVPRPLIS